jgi:hydrogenase nickel incorporation protein HypB
MRSIGVQEAILSENDRLAAQNRGLLARRGIFAINLMASPGAGKTSLIARSIECLRGKLRLAVIEGDIASSIDTDRLASMGVPAVQINTGGDCHLEAHAVAQALSHLSLEGIDLLFIENVGNLVCPTSFDLGESSKVMVSSVSEGDDKPQKYPAMFQAVDVVILNKTDLLGICPFDCDPFLRAVRQLNPDVQIFELSCLTGAGMDAWSDWLKERVDETREIRRPSQPGGLS